MSVLATPNVASKRTLSMSVKRLESWGPGFESVDGEDDRRHDMIKQADVEEPKIYSQEMKPILRMFQLSGTMPVFKTQEGWQCKLVSVYSLYSFIFYLLAMYFLVSALVQVVHGVITTPDFDDQMFMELVTMLLFQYCLVPITSWIDAFRLAKYLNFWDQFQVQYLQVTTRHLPLNIVLMVRLALLFTPLIIIACGSMFFYFPEHLSVSYLIPFIINIMPATGVLYFWLTTSRVLGDAGEHLAECFKQEIDSNKCSLQMLNDYKQLWRSLSELTTLTGGAIYRTAAVPTIMSIWIITLSIYGLIISMAGGKYELVLIYFQGTFLFTLPFYLICNESYWAPIKVRSNILVELHKLNTLNCDAEELEEVQSFLDVIKMSSPRITLGGYIVVDRQMFQGAGATIVTYLIVVLQFRLTMLPTEQHSYVNSTLVDVF